MNLLWLYLFLHNPSSLYFSLFHSSQTRHKAHSASCWWIQALFPHLHLEHSKSIQRCVYMYLLHYTSSWHDAWQSTGRTLISIVFVLCGICFIPNFIILFFFIHPTCEYHFSPCSATITFKLLTFIWVYLSNVDITFQGGIAPGVTTYSCI